MTNPEFSELAVRTRFEALYEPEPMSGCWLWLGARQPKGYGLFWWSPGSMLSHRAAYRLYIKEIPDDLTLDHLCRVRACVNPKHMEPVTNHENILRGNGSPATNARKTECENGHPFSPANTYLRPEGGRRCRLCQSRLHLDWRQRQLGGAA